MVGADLDSFYVNGWISGAVARQRNRTIYLHYILVRTCQGFLDADSWVVGLLS